MREGLASARFGARPIATFARISAFVVAALGLTACDTELLADAPDGTCTEAGSRCVLPAGPLGVCERSTCVAGAPEPCFACVSQH